MHSIMIIEDDLAMRREVSNLLEKANYKVIIPQNFDISEILTSHPELILLDINLPNVSGETLLKELRQKSDIPVIMLTSRNSETDELISMSYGADDYITKPYNPHILLLRISAVLKRTETSTNVLRFRDLRIDLARGVIERDASEDGQRPQRILLTKNEMIIIRHLLNNQGQIVSRDALMTDLWNNHEYINDNALTVNVSRLRAKFNTLGADDAIETRKGLGYILS